eukprot:2727031-Rhodomonas_salina.1
MQVLSAVGQRSRILAADQYAADVRTGHRRRTRGKKPGGFNTGQQPPSLYSCSEKPFVCVWFRVCVPASAGSAPTASPAPAPDTPRRFQYESALSGRFAPRVWFLGFDLAA